jgi:hypothetical protein
MCPRCNASQYKQNINIEEYSYNNKRKGQKRENTFLQIETVKGLKREKLMPL